MNILLGVTGGVAAKLVPKIVAEIKCRGNRVKIISTRKALYFWNPEDFSDEVFTDQDEWAGIFYTENMPIAHIELRKWADVLLIAPLTANTLAKMANGMADNLLTCVIRAWEIEKPIIIAPAMNTAMWIHPATQCHLEILNRWYNLRIINPIKKQLACGESGVGAMANIKDIVDATMQ